MTSQIGPVNAGQPGVRQAGPAAWQATSAVRAASQRTLERVVPRRALRVLKRLVASAAVILSVVTVTFLVTRVFAPDPTSLFLGASGNGFASAAAEAAEKAQVRASLGLNDPVLVQYWHFLGQLAHGNLGVSYETGRPVTQDLLSRLPATAELAVYALLIGVTLGVLAGVIAAVRAGGSFDRVVRFFTDRRPHDAAVLDRPHAAVGLLHQAPHRAGADRAPAGRGDPAAHRHRLLRHRRHPRGRVGDRLGRRPRAHPAGHHPRPRPRRAHRQGRAHLDAGIAHLRLRANGDRPRLRPGGASGSPTRSRTGSCRSSPSWPASSPSPSPAPSWSRGSSAGPASATTRCRPSRTPTSPPSRGSCCTRRSCTS